MNARSVIGLCVLVGLSASPALAQDPVKVDPAHYKVLLDNPSVRVLKVTYPAGSKSVMHHHPDAIVVALDASKTRFTMPDGTTQDSDLTDGSAMYTPAGTHRPENVGTGPLNAILVEFKAAAPGTAAIPTSRPNMALKTLAEGPRGVAVRSTADPSFHEPAGTKHDYDQVVIATAPSQMTLAVDGQPKKTSWKRGDVAFIGRGTAHESSNSGTAPVDFVIVAIK